MRSRRSAEQRDDSPGTVDRAPGKAMLTDRLAVQRRAEAGAPAELSAASASASRGDDPFWFADAAASGVDGADAPLPHGDTIRQAFGSHGAALDGVRAQVGGPAAEAAGAIGAEAYALGERVAFAGEPDLHLAAHEATHVVQQRAGVSLSGGVGAAGDAYERHADAVADAVVAGRSAQGLLDHGPAGGSAAPAVQRKPAAEDPEEKLERIVVHIDHRMTLAENDMGKGDEVAAIEEHAHAVAVLLGEASRLVRAMGEGGEAARHVSQIERLAPAINSLYAWARKVQVFQGKVELDTVFDRWDRLRQDVGLDPQGKARTYYADWKVNADDLEQGQFAKKDPTQADLVDDCVRMFSLDQTFGPAMAIEQFETMLAEPPMPSGGPDFLEGLLMAAVQGVLGMIPGKLGGVIEALLGDAEPKLAKVIAGFAEQSSETIIAEASRPDEAIGEGQMKTEYLDRIRRGAFTAMREMGGAVTEYRAGLERMPPHQVAEVHRQLKEVPAKLWARLKQDIVVAWINFRASLPHGLVEGRGSELDFDPDRREGESFGEQWARKTARAGIVEIYADVAGDTLEVTKVSIDGIEPAVRRELAEANYSFMRMPLHRTVMLSRTAGHYGNSERMASVYLTSTGQLVPQYIDEYFMTLYGRGEPLEASWEDGNQRDDDEKRGRAAFTPDDGQIQIGIYRALGKIKTTSSDLG